MAGSCGASGSVVGAVLVGAGVGWLAGAPLAAAGGVGTSTGGVDVCGGENLGSGGTVVTSGVVGGVGWLAAVGADDGRADSGADDRILSNPVAGEVE
ncbi:hypothetical protein [Dickeya chrysanthemi]|uniref:hypothetical protein n=1 Tax=Dickeya chrysanthemi TaxID=556 RepID=UPI000587C7B4|nr:hypothetical protein [Dickeya chrysanthemi]MBX9444221.1 hypothetical protein [Dickeya chrysanthemi]